MTSYRILPYSPKSYHFRTQQQQQPQQARESLGEELRQRQRQDGFGAKMSIQKRDYGICSGGPAVKVYIGIKTSDEAESIVTRPTDFKIYHKLSEVSMSTVVEPKLPYPSSGTRHWCVAHQPLALHRVP